MGLKLRWLAPTDATSIPFASRARAARSPCCPAASSWLPTARAWPAGAARGPSCRSAPSATRPHMIRMLATSRRTADPASRSVSHQMRPRSSSGARAATWHASRWLQRAARVRTRARSSQRCESAARVSRGASRRSPSPARGSTSPTSTRRPTESSTRAFLCGAGGASSTCGPRRSCARASTLSSGSSSSFAPVALSSSRPLPPQRTPPSTAWASSRSS
mmetsp:Transcript_5130/g.16719  ORF Transcript_5130/g.16719 Transcript_5130/m.16719 type:complete len:219 (-) Transcript_5130:366-1022(-)